MLRLTEKQEITIGHWMAGVISLAELKDYFWLDQMTAEELPNGKLRIEDRNTQWVKVI